MAQPSASDLTYRRDPRGTPVENLCMPEPCARSYPAVFGWSQSSFIMFCHGGLNARSSRSTLCYNKKKPLLFFEQFLETLADFDNFWHATS